MPPGNRQKERRLARAVGPENPENLTGFEREIDVAEHRRPIALHGQPANGQWPRPVSDPPRRRVDRNRWRPDPEEALGPEEQQAAEGEAIDEDVGLWKDRPEQELVERIKRERPDQSAERVESPSQHPQDQRYDREGRRKNDGRFDTSDEMRVKGARHRRRGRAQRERAPARRDEVDSQGERRLGRLANRGSGAAARPAEERLVAENDGQDQYGQCHDERGRGPVEARRLGEEESLHSEGGRI